MLESTLSRNRREPISVHKPDGIKPVPSKGRVADKPIPPEWIRRIHEFKASLDLSYRSPILSDEEMAKLGHRNYWNRPLPEPRKVRKATQCRCSGCVSKRAERKTPDSYLSPTIMGNAVTAMAQSIRTHYPDIPAMDRDDLVSKAFLGYWEAFQEGGTVRLPDDPYFIPSMRRRAMNAARNYVQRKGQEGPIVDPESASDPASLSKRTSAAVRRAIGKLGTTEQLLAKSYLQNGASVPATADALGMTQREVHHAIKALAATIRV